MSNNGAVEAGRASRGASVATLTSWSEGAAHKPTLVVDDGTAQKVKKRSRESVLRDMVEDGYVLATSTTVLVGEGVVMWTDTLVRYPKGAR